MIELADGQFELLESSLEDADGLLMGRRSPVGVRSFSPGTPEQRAAMSPRPMADGVAFGRGLRGGRLYALALNAQSWTPALPRAAYGASPGTEPALEALTWTDRVESAWAADQVRLVPGAVQVLRWRTAGRTRRIYGRGGNCAPDTSNPHTGVIPIEAEFQAEDDLVYSDLRKVTTVGIVPPANAWTTWPLTWPITWTKPVAGTVGTITVGGTRATWPTFTLHGPISAASIVVGGYGELKLNGALAFDQTLYIDTRPWNRGIRRENGASVPGVLDTRATTLPQLRFPPGSYSVALKGTDPTGTASLVVEHRDAFSSI